MQKILIIFVLTLLAANFALSEEPQQEEFAAVDETEATEDDKAPAREETKTMSGMSILGNEEAPKSLVIIPWKSSEIGSDLSLSDTLDDMPRIDLGIAYHRLGDLQAAESNLLQALELSPEHPIVHNELGIIYRKTGRFTDARKSYEAALAVYPRYHFARRNLAVLCDLYLADLRCALENYEAYMATVPGDDEATMWIADIRSRMDK